MFLSKRNIPYLITNKHVETCCLPTLAQDLGRSAGSTPWVDHDGPGKYAANQLSKTHGKTMGKWKIMGKWKTMGFSMGKSMAKSIIFCDFHENPWENP